MNYFHHIDLSTIHIDFLVISKMIDGTLRNEIEKKHSMIYCLPIRENNSVICKWNSLKSFFKKHNNEYLIVHSHVFLLDVVLFFLAKKHGVKICISHSHSTNWSDYKLRAIRNRLMALLIPYCADVWGACSLLAGEFLYGKCFSYSAKKWIVHNAIEISKFRFDIKRRELIRREFGYKNEIVLGSVGRLVPVKNQVFLLEIMKELMERGYEDYRLLIVGDGELHITLIKKAEQLGVSKYVTFAGTRSDIPDMLWAMDAFLLPSFHEGLPVSGIEAQATGLPCLFSEEVSWEANISNVVYLPIDRGTKVWVDEICTLNRERYVNAARNVMEAGYDIKTEAENISKQYLMLADNVMNIGETNSE